MGENFQDDINKILALVALKGHADLKAIADNLSADTHRREADLFVHYQRSKILGRTTESSTMGVVQPKKADNDDCSICLTPFGSNTRVYTVKPCSHMFHGTCIALWLLKKSADDYDHKICPICYIQIRHAVVSPSG